MQKSIDIIDTCIILEISIKINVFDSTYCLGFFFQPVK